MTRLLSVSAEIIDNHCQRLNLGTAMTEEKMAASIMIVVDVFTLFGKEAIFSRVLWGPPIYA
jgi:hypothetical protein